MAYELIVTEHADELLDNLVQHLLYRLKSEQAARHLLDGIRNVYERLEENPMQFPLSRDAYLANKGYHEAVVPQMDYMLVFNVKADVVNVVGVFHQLENYQRKISFQNLWFSYFSLLVFLKNHFIIIIIYRRNNSVKYYIVQW
ncbi:MAG: type II toxin-antitoxin system RelE/ParE family toxin [Lachnospiraceae bacterium]|nr:type II toxin-antitoxin system RelE/ParE family toxin [Lachnospiraceae bacterium]